MKLILSLIASASVAGATSTCQLPSEYALQTGTGGCGGPNTGYVLTGFCITGYDPVAVPSTASLNIKSVIDSTTASLFTPQTGDGVGCSVPAAPVAWSSVMVSPLNCLAMIGNAITGTSPTIKGVTVQCDLTNNFYPTQGVEGSMVCMGGFTAPPPPIFTNPGQPTLPYWSSGNFVPQGVSSSASGITQFTGAEALRCTRACALPENLCSNGRLTANVAVSGNGLIPGTCLIRPTSTLSQASIQVRCATATNTADAWTFTCNAPAPNLVPTPGTPSNTNNGTLVISGPSTVWSNQCGSANGALTPAFTNSLTVPRQMRSGSVRNYPSVTAVLRAAFTDAFAFAETGDRRYWNNNPAQTGSVGTAYAIDISGCDTAQDLSHVQCVQQTLNWFRCKEDVPFTPGTVCTAGGLQIPCPTHSLGFRCPGGSKKGLYGLFGLLGIIPLVLLCCCLLLLLFGRSKSDPNDVHFATYASHGHAGTALAAPGMHSIMAPSIIAGPQGVAIPLGFGHTPGL